METTKAARDAAAFAAETSLGVDVRERGSGQDHTIPIQVDDIVAIHVDNYQWPEYPVSIALVVGVTPPASPRQERRGKEANPRPGAGRGKGGDGGCGFFQ